MPTQSSPVFPICKLAEYTVTASSTRRRSLVRQQILQSLSDPEKRRWRHLDAKAEIRKFFRNPSLTKQHLSFAARQLRDSAGVEKKKSKQETLLASARAIEAFAPLAEASRSREVLASPGRREGAHIHRGGVKIVVSPDLIFLERGSERIVGALKLHASQEYKLETDALRNSATILYTYLLESGEKPVRDHCTVIDLFTPAVESAPRGIHRRMIAVEAACEEINALWHAMFERVHAEVARRGETR